MIWEGICGITTGREKYSRTALVRTLAILIASYPDWLDSSAKHFPTLTVLHLLWPKFFRICQMHIRNYVLLFLFVETSRSINVGNFLTSCKPVSFSRRTLHHGVSK